MKELYILIVHLSSNRHICAQEERNFYLRISTDVLEKFLSLRRLAPGSYYGASYNTDSLQTLDTSLSQKTTWPFSKHSKKLTIN